ncbi:photosystem II assembly protein Psb35 [Synechococcus sp. PCC 7336]|uniref:photosystem II assembly protein Psb35 n=1 Tax=Synechococcus sp. PCC 7336 TaxID=195250 RepID=UPI0008FBE731|nr:hypothetical protein [Synechococcus sp. PCC 7336]
MLPQQTLFHIFSTTSSLSESHFPYAAVAALVVGFLGAVSIGSIAWYNSRRPVGWQDKEKPDFVPDVKQ